MGRIVTFLDTKLYPDCKRGWDNTAFAEKLGPLLKDNSVVLDLGAGAGICSELDLRGGNRRICGIDPDPVVMSNPFLDDAKVATGDAIPYPDKTFDIVIAHNVLEHLAEPEKVFSEVRRVLKPGGCFAIKTPNKFHYVPLIASITPQWFHVAFNNFRGRKEEDTYPTCYRANTPNELKSYAEKSGLVVDEVELIEKRPEYLRFSALTYLAGWAYEKLVNRVSCLSGFRVVMLGTMRRIGS